MAKTPSYRDGLAPEADDIVPMDAQARSFVAGLVARGQAAPADASGALPRGATHEIVGETADGAPILRRRRISGG